MTFSDWTIAIALASLQIVVFIVIIETFIHYVSVPAFFYKEHQTYPKLIAFILFIIVITFITFEVTQFLGSKIFQLNKEIWNQHSFENFVLLLQTAIISVMARSIYEWINGKKRILELENEKMQTELSFLKAQMNPHFLFNSINIIFGSIEKSNKIARSMVLLFSDMLRYQLYECTNDKIDLQKEMDYLNNFIELQKNRKNKSLKVETNFDIAAGGYKIAPLLFIPFVENAFKYVSAHDDDTNFIKISLIANAPHICFSCENTKDAISVKPLIQDGGIGIQNVNKRLELIYKDNYELKIDNSEKHFKIQLIIFNFFDQKIFPNEVTKSSSIMMTNLYKQT